MLDDLIKNRCLPMDIGEFDDSGRQITETGEKTTGIKFFLLMSQNLALEMSAAHTSGADKEKNFPQNAVCLPCSIQLASCCGASWLLVESVPFTKLEGS